jgi:hypothetical protein
VGVLAAVAIGWLVWAATFHSSPPVRAEVSAYEVVSDSRIKVTVTVNRRDPAQPVACRVMAQATDFQPVAEELVRVPPRPENVVDVKIELTTLRRATTATVRDCSVL